MKFLRTHSSFFIIYILFLILLAIGTYIRFLNVSPFKFYPDAYQSLLVARNIQNYHSVVGYLGKEGMLFPEFFMWTRPGYPLLITLFQVFSKDSTAVAQAISFGAGILSLPLAFFLCKRVFGSSLYGLAGMLLLTLSFNHTVWSGFIMTETLGVFFLLIFLIRFFSGLRKKAIFADLLDFATGMVFAFAVLTRYEYIILALPALMILFIESPQAWIRTLNITASFCLLSAIIFSRLFPLPTIGAFVLGQLWGYVSYSVFVAAVFIIGSSLFWKIPQKIKTLFVTKAGLSITAVLWLGAGYIVLQFATGSSLSFLWRDLDFARTFFTHEIVITLFSLIGISLMLQKAHYRIYGFFVLLSIAPLILIYHKVNPAMDRYLTHILPFLLIPASYGVVMTLTKAFQLLHKPFLMKKLIGGGLLIFFGILLILQWHLTTQGIKNWTDRSWFRTSYEEQAAFLVKTYLSDPDAILLVSFPESYAYFTHFSTVSIADSYPYVFLPDSLNKKKLYIIDDMGMRDIFPHFANLLETTIHPRKNVSFWVHRPYHFAHRSVNENKSVVVYELTVEQLKKSIRDTHKK